LVDEIYRLSNDIVTLHNIYDNITSFGLVFISVTLVFCLLFQRSSSKKLLILHMVLNTKQLGQPILCCSEGPLGITRQLQKWYFSFAKIKTQCFLLRKVTSFQASSFPMKPLILYIFVPLYLSD